MRRLHPEPSGPVDPAEAYAYPSEPGPWLRANMVASVDGAATLEGSSRGLSGAPDRRLLRLLRGLADVVLVGAGTVRRERYGAAQPQENWQSLRRAAGQPPAPAMAVISRSLDLDPAAGLFTRAQPGARTVVLTAARAPADRRRALAEVADVIVAGEEEVAIGRAVDELARGGRTRLLCEGGPRFLAQVAAAGRLDELCLTVSPLLCAGGAPRILAGEGIEPPARMELAHALEEDGNLFLRYTRSGRSS